MKFSPTMQRIVTQLAQKHRVNLAKLEAHLCLHLPGYERLAIETIGRQQVSVAHYFEQNGDLVPDPDIVFFTGRGGWLPIEITYSFGLYRRYATLNETATHLKVRDAVQQADLANFAEMWAQNLIDQGWLSHGRP